MISLLDPIQQPLFMVESNDATSASRSDQHRPALSAGGAGGVATLQAELRREHFDIFDMVILVKSNQAGSATLR